MTEEKKTDMVLTNGKGLQITSLSEAYRFSQQVCKSGMVPAGLNTPEKVLVAAQTGMEAGLTFMAAVKAVYVIKGTPAWYGKAAKGLILNKGVCESWEQGWEGEDDDRHAWVKSRRKGLDTDLETVFSMAQAKRRQLTGKGEWKNEPDNMLMWRAIGRHCDQWYSDVLLGLPLVEVAGDSDWVDPLTGQGEEEVPSTPDPLMAQIEAPKEAPKKNDKQVSPEQIADEAEFETVEDEKPDDPKVDAMKAKHEKKLTYTLFLGSKYCSDKDNQIAVDGEWILLLEEFGKKKESEYTHKDYLALSDHIAKTGI